MTAGSEQDRQASAALRLMLWFAIPLGILILLLGPLALISSEGFGDKPGPASESEFWRTLSWIVMPFGAGLSGLGAFGLFVLRLRDRVSVERESKTVIESARKGMPSGKPPV